MQAWNAKILITDLTAMGGDRVCIAGVDNAGQTVRPVLWNGVRYSHLLRDGKALIRPRAVLRMRLAPKRAAAPHMEDHDWHERESLHSMEYLLEEARWQRVLQGLVERCPRPLFGAGLESHRSKRQRKLDSRQATHSLATVSVKQVKFLCEQDIFEEGKYRYRLSFRDDQENSYDYIPITDLALQAWAAAQLRQGTTAQSLSDRLTTRLQDAQQIYLRLGLGREFKDEFWLQVNGIYSFPDWLAGRCFADFDETPG